MTKQEMYDIVFQSFQNQLQDMPDGQERIGKMYSAWVQSLIQEGNSLLNVNQNTQAGIPQEPMETGQPLASEPSQK